MPTQTNRLSLRQRTDAMAILRPAVSHPRTASPLVLRIAVAVALAITAAVHLLLASTYASGSQLVGAAFIVGGVVSLIAAVWVLASDSDLAWALAAAVSAAMLLGLLVSATVGLFGITTAQLGAAEGASVATELFVVVAWAVTRLRRR